jgi:hypothetical protein
MMKVINIFTACIVITVSIVISIIVAVIGVERIEK